jgi:hypothetical protein
MTARSSIPTYSCSPTVVVWSDRRAVEERTVSCACWPTRTAWKRRNERRTARRNEEGKEGNEHRAEGIVTRALV